MTGNNQNSGTTQWDLAVCYRIYPGLSGRPMLGFTDKLVLATEALKSFKCALGRLRAKIYVLLDGCPLAYQELFESLFDPEGLELIPLQSAGNANTFRKQIEVLSAQQTAEIVYFAEDDYLYL